MKDIFVILIAFFGMTSYSHIKKGKVVDMDGNPIKNADPVNRTTDNI